MFAALKRNRGGEEDHVSVATKRRDEVRSSLARKVLCDLDRDHEVESPTKVERLSQIELVVLCRRYLEQSASRGVSVNTHAL